MAAQDDQPDYTPEQWRAVSDAVAAAMEYAHERAIEHPDQADPLWNLDEYVNKVMEIAFPEPCEMVRTSWDDGQCMWGSQCSACGTRFAYESGTSWRFCPSCGHPLKKTSITCP